MGIREEIKKAQTEDEEPTQREELKAKLIGWGLSENDAEVILTQLITPVVWQAAGYVYDSDDLVAMMTELGWPRVPGGMY